MLEIRYNTDDKRVTAWRGNPKRFGNLDRDRPEGAIIVLDIPLPEKNCTAYLYDEATRALTLNPNYVEPEPPRDPLAEIDELKAEIEKLKEVN